MSVASEGAKRSDTSFGLLKFVSWGTLVLILLSSLFLSIFLANQARQALLEKQRDFAQLLATTLGNDINKRFYIPNFWAFGRPDLGKPDQYKRLDEVVHFALEGSPARDIRLYDPSGLVVYAQDKALLGKEGLGGESILQAVNEEKFSYEFIYQASSLGAFFSAGIEPNSVTMRVYAPLRIKGVIPVAMLDGEGLPQGNGASPRTDAPASSKDAGQPGGAEVRGEAAPSGGVPQEPPRREELPGRMAPFESGAAGPASEAAPSAGPDAPAEPSSARKPSGASRVPSSALEPSSALPGQPAGRLVEVEGVIGGLEFTMDITPDYQKLITFQRIIIFANLANALVIFFILRTLIHRADRISAQRMKEKEEFEREIVQNEKLASMGRMVAGIAHEIRNPLGIIRSSSELLVSRMKDKDPLTAKILTAINEEAVRLSKTVGEFLDYARPKPLRLEPVDLGVVLDQVLAFLEQKCRELDVEVVRDYQPGLTVRGDKDLLYRAIYNILANAMEAMAGQPRDEDEGMRGQIVVRASLEKEGPVLTVLDTGPGIPADIRDKLTDPFFTTKQNGTGLGLAITANILRGHGAALALGDNLGGGARVDILFPTS